MSQCIDFPFKAGGSYVETATDTEPVCIVVEGVEVCEDVPVAIEDGTVIRCSVLTSDGVLHPLVIDILDQTLNVGVFTLFLADTSSWPAGIAKRDIKFVKNGISSPTLTDTFIVQGFITP